MCQSEWAVASRQAEVMVAALWKTRRFIPEVTTRFVLILLIGIPGRAVAQLAEPSFRELGYRFEESRDVDQAGFTFLARAPDYRYEGMALGGIIGAVVSVLGGSVI